MTPYLTNVEVFPIARGFLSGRGANSTSQFGEDGLIQACLEKFDSVNQWCFEVGAHDGLFFSNTHRMRCEGWNAVLIEADPDLYTRLCEQKSERVQCVNETIGPESLDRILFESGAPSDLDVGVIDIDGQDYWVWDGMESYQPRLMLVEFEYGSDNASFSVPAIGGPGQANYQAIKQLGIEKGYTPLAKTTVNLLFVKSELL